MSAFHSDGPQNVLCNLGVVSRCPHPTDTRTDTCSQSGKSGRTKSRIIFLVGLFGELVSNSEATKSVPPMQKRSSLNEWVSRRLWFFTRSRGGCTSEMNDEPCGSAAPICLERDLEVRLCYEEESVGFRMQM